MVLPFLGPLLGGLFTAANAPALIGAGASLLGGALNRSAENKAIEKQNEYNAPINVRARAEAAGFNPLLFAGPGVGQQTTTGGSAYMGSAIADAGMMLAESLSRRQDLGRLEKLQSDNQKLAEKVTNLTLRPKIGGIYASRVSTPTMAQALGRGGGNVRVDRQKRGGGVHPEIAGAFAASGSGDVEPKDRNTYERFFNNGVSTDVPLGPDIDEVMTGAVIAMINRDKAYRSAHSFGQPLRIGRQTDRNGNITGLLPPFNTRPPRSPVARARNAPAFGFTPHMGFGF